MAIDFTTPLSLPTVTGIRNIEFRAKNAVAYSQSPFTFAGQAHAYSGEIWEADITLPPMKRAAAEVWLSFLISLRGSYNKFYLGDPDGKTARGTASSVVINGTAGERVVDVNVPSSETLKAGDYFSLGSGNSMRLYKVLADYTGTGSSEANALDIWPALRANASSETADITSPTGVFRLANNEQSWTANHVSTYGITFGAFEAI